MADLHPEESEIEVTSNTMFSSYTTTATSFIKRNLHPSQLIRDCNGNAITRPWPEERLFNEAAALTLISERTTIPVPKVLSYGKNNDGTAYLETELILGIECDRVGDECRMSKERAHNDGGPCSSCDKIAKTNTQRFILDEILPQLEMLKSSTTGLNGFVMPPPWVLEFDTRPQWAPKMSDDLEYVFCHGDLAAHNIMVHPETFHVLGIFDWEHAGYFPPAFQLWTLELKEYHQLFEDKDRLRELIALIDT